ncbi:MAG TPA: YdcF family protein [Casimicrobiaceae bacterium]|nr:YdcF family protein [Casimicrobiaceae bacterium]
MIDIVWLKALVKTLILPPTGLLLLSAIGLGLRQRFPRVGIAMAWTGVIALLVLSIPFVSVSLVRALDQSPPFDIAHASEAQAIVILGGGVRHHAPDYGGDTVAELTLERIRYGARLARLTHLPVLVTGGTVLAGEPEGKLMQAVLEREFGVNVRWVEDRSRNTHENAAYSAQILKRAGVNSVVLVAHSFDMPRARAEFATAGITTLPAPTGIPSSEPYAPFDFLPTLGGLRTSYYALYEITANLARWLGRVFD